MSGDELRRELEAQTARDAQRARESADDHARFAALQADARLAAGALLAAGAPAGEVRVGMREIRTASRWRRRVKYGPRRERGWLVQASDVWVEGGRQMASARIVLTVDGELFLGPASSARSRAHASEAAAAEVRAALARLMRRYGAQLPPA